MLENIFGNVNVVNRVNSEMKTVCVHNQCQNAGKASSSRAVRFKDSSTSCFQLNFNLS